MTSRVLVVVPVATCAVSANEMMRHPSTSGLAVYTLRAFRVGLRACGITGEEAGSGSTIDRAN